MSLVFRGLSTDHACEHQMSNQTELRGTSPTYHMPRQIITAWKCYNTAALLQATSRPPALPMETLNDSLLISSDARESATKPSQTAGSELVEPSWLDDLELSAISDCKPLLDNTRSSTDDQNSGSVDTPVWTTSVESDINERSNSCMKRLRSARSASRLACSDSETFFSVILQWTSQLH